MDLTKFEPKNLKKVKAIDFETLNIKDIETLARNYPHMDGVLLIQRKDGTGIKSPATYRSFYSLIKSGHQFKIVGTKYGEPAPTQEEIVVKAKDIEIVEFIEPPATIFLPKQSEPKKRGRKSKIFNQ